MVDEKVKAMDIVKVKVMIYSEVQTFPISKLSSKLKTTFLAKTGELVRN